MKERIMTEEEKEEARASERQRRALETIERVQRIVERWSYMAPELAPAALCSLHTLLCEHFGISHAHDGMAHVGEIVRSIESRKKSEPGFAKALADYLASREGETIAVHVVSRERGDGT